MSLLQFIIIIAAIVFILFGNDLYKRKKMNILHFIVFLWGGTAIILFTFNPVLLDNFGEIFWVARWADVLVYIAITFLFYLIISIINKQIKIDIKQTKILRYIAINERKWDIKPNTEVVLIMPCYKNHATVEFVKNILNKWYGIVFIDDGYNSKLLITGLYKLIEDWNNLVVISHPFNMWQWAAIQTGQEYIFNKTDVKYITHFDSDWQHNIDDIPKFLHEFKKNSKLEIVVWSRFIWNETKMWSRRKFNKKLQLLFTHIFIWLRLTDTHNGFRMLKYDTIPKINITLNDYSHASEIEMIIKQNKLLRKEVPVNIIYDDTINQQWQPLSNAINIAKRILYRLFFFR